MSVDPTKVSALVQALKDVFENKQVNKKNDISGDYSGDSVSYPTVKAVKDELALKQDALNSGTNIKTINGESILGSGNITVSAGSVDLIEIAQSLPAASSSTMNKLYLVAEATSKTQDNYEVFVTVRTGSSPNYSYAWEKVDTARVDLSGYSLTSHTHGNITSDGKIGSTSGKPVITTTGGAVTTGAFGTSSGQFAEGNHTHSGYISTSSTAGLVKNDGTIDTTTYLSSLPSHTHGNLTNDGKVGSNANYIIVTTTGGAITSVQKLGNITYDGKIGSTSGLPIITTTNGKLTTGSFGSTSGTFAEGNHTHSGYTSSSDVDSQIDAALDAITTALSS